LLPVEGGKPGKATAFIDTPAAEGLGRLSPDGRWLAFVSDQTGRPEVYVTSVPDKQVFYRVSGNGGTRPVWAQNGRSLLYAAPEPSDSIMQADVAPDGRASTPRVLFRPGFLGTGNQVFDISPDGKRLLVRTSRRSSPNSQLNVVVNWPALLKQ
jgi:Tol biopolymer transport system component